MLARKWQSRLEQAPATRDENVPPAGLGPSRSKGRRQPPVAVDEAHRLIALHSVALERVVGHAPEDLAQYGVDLGPCAVGPESSVDAQSERRVSITASIKKDFIRSVECLFIAVRRGVQRENSLTAAQQFYPKLSVLRDGARHPRVGREGAKKLFDGHRQRTGVSDQYLAMLAVVIEVMQCVAKQCRRGFDATEDDRQGDRGDVLVGQSVIVGEVRQTRQHRAFRWPLASRGDTSGDNVEDLCECRRELADLRAPPGRLREGFPGYLFLPTGYVTSRHDPETPVALGIRNRTFRSQRRGARDPMVTEIGGVVIEIDAEATERAPNRAHMRILSADTVGYDIRYRYIICKNSRSRMSFSVPDDATIHRTGLKHMRAAIAK